MPAVGDELDLAIESVAYLGNGVARHGGMVVFVPGVAPGEQVRARVERVHRTYAEARLIAVSSPSPDRRAPDCRLPDGTHVPGCVYDHLAYPAECAIKQAQLESFLRRLPGCGAVPFPPPVASPLSLHYRNKIVLHVAEVLADRSPSAGYRGDDPRTVVDIPACPLAREPINESLARFRASPAFNRLRTGEHLTFRWTQEDGVVAWSGSRDPQRPVFLLPGTGKTWTSASRLTERAPFGPVQVPLAGFYQVNPEVADALVRQVSLWYGEAGVAGDVLDFYSGVGVFAIACARAGARRTIGLESGRAAVDAAKDNARTHGVRVEFRCQGVGAAAQKLLAGCDRTRTVVIADPPRQGMEPEAVDAIAAAKPRLLFYVSCDPATLARDLQRLLPAGFTVRQARLFDLFPRTAHFETVVWLDGPA
jgi:23S rRNA (uracil1939-C5)-methyltransferase